MISSLSDVLDHASGHPFPVVALHIYIGQAGGRGGGECSRQLQNATKKTRDVFSVIKKPKSSFQLGHPEMVIYVKTYNQ